MKHTPTYGWFIWILGTLFYMYQFVLRASPNAMAKDFMEAFSIHATSLGILSSCYYYAYASLQIPLGTVLDKIGSGRVIRLAIIVCVTGVLLLASASTFLVACLGRTLIGIGASGAFLSTLALARLWLPPSRVALAVGLTFAAGKFGGFMSGLPLTYLVETYDWRMALLVLSVVGGMIGCLLWIFIDTKAEKQKKQTTVNTSSLMENILYILKAKRLWLIACYGGLMFVPLSTFTDMWGTLFIMKKHTADKAAASFGIGLVFIGTVFGGPLAAILSNKLQSRKKVMIASSLASFVVSSTFTFMPYNSLYLSYALLMLLGFCMAGQSLTFTVSAEAMPASMGGLATGVANSVVMMGGVILQPLVGLILDLAWNGLMENGLPFYTLSNYVWALSIVPSAMGISLLLSIFLPETHPSRKAINPEQG